MRATPAVPNHSLVLSPAVQALLLWIAGSGVMTAFTMMGLSAAFADGQYVPAHNDAFYHARRILDAVMTGQPIAQFDPHMHVPEGSWVTWPWSYDAAMATLTRLFGPFPSEAAANAVLMNIPVFAGPLAVALVVCLARLLRLGFLPGLMLVLGFACLPAVHSNYAVGNIDHHFAESLWTSATLCAGIGFWRNPRRIAPALLLGAVLGSACGVHVSLFILQVPLVALYLLRWLRGEALPPWRVTLALGGALLLVTLALCLPSGPFRQGFFDLYTLSWFQLYIAAGTALFTLLPSILPRRAPQVALVAMLGVAALVPVFGMILRGTSFVGGHIESTQGILEIYSPYTILFEYQQRFGTPYLLNALWLAMPALLYACWLVVKAREGEIQFFALAAVMGLALLQLQTRLHVFGELALLAVPLLALRRAVDRWPARATRILLGAGVLFLLVIFPVKDHYSLRWRLANAPGYAEIRAVFPVLKAACLRNPGVVLADTEAGHWVRYHTQCSVIGNLFLLTPQQADKARITEELMSRSPREIAQAQPRISYVLVYHDVSIDPRREPDLETLRRQLPALEGALLGPLPGIDSSFKLLWALDTPAGQPYARLFEVVRASP